MTAAFVYRGYQEQAVQKGVTFFEKRQKNQVEVIPTGGGKSVVIGGIATNLPGKTLVLQPSKEILAQNYKKAEKFLYGSGFQMGDYDLGIYSASFGMKQKRRITFATIGSIFKKRDEFRDFDRIIMDECDLTNAQGGQYVKLFDQLGLPLLGLTDSPYRLYPPAGGNNSVIKFIHRTRPRVLTGLLHVTQNRELFDAGYLTRPDYIKETFHSEQLSFNSTGAEFTDESIRKYNLDNDTVGKMFRYVREIDAKHVMAVCNDLTEARNLHNRLVAVGQEPLLVHGEMEDRDGAQQAFTSGRNRIAIVCGMWTVGFDFPALDGVVNGKITNSARLYKQIVGRGVRLDEHNENKKFSYVDVGGNVQRFGKVEEFDIVGEPGKERLKSDVGFLTGVDLKTRFDIEANAAARYAAEGDGPLFPGNGQPQQSGNSGTINFGKYRGQQISAVPAGYLHWMKENMTNWALKKQAIDEIHRRNQLKAELQHGV